MKTYTIPLRKAFQDSAPMKRTPRAVKAVQQYITKHCKVEDVKLGAQLNQHLWKDGIKNPPARVTVTADVADGVAKVELEGHTYIEAKKAEKKTEETLKDKIVSKLGTPKKTKGAPEKAAEPAKQEEPKKETATATPKPVKQDS